MGTTILMEFVQEIPLKFQGSGLRSPGGGNLWIWVLPRGAGGGGEGEEMSQEG